MINEDRYIEFIIENKVTQTQFLLLHLLFRKRWDLIQKYKIAFPTGDGSIIGKAMTDDLLEKGLITYSKSSDKGIDIQVSKVFKKAYTNDVYIADEFYEVYPSFYRDDAKGISYPLTNYDRMVFAKMYQDKINYSQKEHEEILKDVQFGKEKGLIRVNIGNFLTSEFWKDLRVIRLEEEVDNDKTISDVQDFS